MRRGAVSLRRDTNRSSIQPPPRLSLSLQIPGFTERVAPHTQDAGNGQIHGYVSEAHGNNELHTGNGSNRSVRMER